MNPISRRCWDAKCVASADCCCETPAVNGSWRPSTADTEVAIKALITDQLASTGLRIGDAPDPIARASDAIVRVTAVSLNYGDVQGARSAAVDGTVPGWEAAGIVEAPAADGSGPPAGTRVVSFGFEGAWAQLRSVPATSLALAPKGADLGALATVPVAGVSALSALHRVGPLLGRRVLVTGATGGVGRYAVQLARMGGAEVIALTKSPAAQVNQLTKLGASSVVEDPGRIEGLVDGVIDTVGGPTLVSAFAKLDRDGTLVALGHVTGQPEIFPVDALLSGHGQDNRSIVTFFMPESIDATRAMSWLIARVAEGTLDPGVVWRGSWTRYTEAIEALSSRQLSGKAVLEL